MTIHKDQRWCRICFPKNRTVYFHKDEKTQKVWLYCNKCNKGYSLEKYCTLTDQNPIDVLSNVTIENSQSNEVNALPWSKDFISLSDPLASRGAEYIKSRGLTLEGDMYYDLENDGIVFPYYFGNTFCGAQIRFIEERITEDGDKWKITTLPGTRLRLLIYGYNQETLFANIKGVIITEGAISALSLQQSLNSLYNGSLNNPWKVVAVSGSGGSDHHLELFKSLKDKGYKVVIASDFDEAGLEMAQKYIQAGSCTHTAFTCDSKKDWNDLLKELGNKELAKLFLQNTSSV